MRLRQTGHKRKLTWSIKKPRTIDKLTQELEHKLNFQRNGTKIQKTKNRNGTKIQKTEMEQKYWNKESGP